MSMSSRGEWVSSSNCSGETSLHMRKASLKMYFCSSMDSWLLYPSPIRRHFRRLLEKAMCPFHSLTSLFLLFLRSAARWRCFCTWGSVLLAASVWLCVVVLLDSAVSFNICSVDSSSSSWSGTPHLGLFMAALVASSNTPVTGKPDTCWNSLRAEMNRRSGLLDLDPVPLSCSSRERLTSVWPAGIWASSPSADFMKPYFDRNRWNDAETHTEINMFVNN